LFVRPVAQASTIRERNARPCADVRRTAHRSSCLDSSEVNSSNAFGRPVMTQSYHTTTNLRRMTLASLGLVLNAVVLWNTRYIDAALKVLREQGFPVNDQDAASAQILTQAPGPGGEWGSVGEIVLFQRLGQVAERPQPVVGGLGEGVTAMHVEVGVDQRRQPAASVNAALRFS